MATLTPLLDQLVKENVLLPREAQAANRLPEALQEKALELSEAQRVETMERIVSELLNPKPEHQAVTGHAVAVEHRLERYISWDLVYMVEGWLGDYVPPYRWVRRGFSLACTYFSVQKVFAAMLSIALVYGVYRVVSAGVKWGWHRVVSTEHLAQSPNSTAPSAPPSVLGAGSVPVPQIIGAQYVSGNKLQLNWIPLGEGYTYQVFRNCHPEDSFYKPHPVADNHVSGSGAFVNIAYDNDCVNPPVYVMAFSPAGVPSELSDPVIFHLSLVNNMYSVEPIALEATTASESSVQAAVSRKETVRNPQQTPKTVAPIQNVPTSQPESKKKPSFLNSLAKHLIGDSDGVVDTAIPSASVAEGVNAIKNAALAAHDETKSKEEQQ